MSSQKKICVVTAARSEYGLLRWIIDAIYHSPELELQLVVTGGHLSYEQGYTVKAIDDDGYPIAARVDIQLRTDTLANISKSMGYCTLGLSDTFEKLKPDMLIVLGDRYELLPICSSALVMNIPIAHISGGDVTEGAIDDAVRNAVTMMSDLHFPGNEQSAANIARMKGSDKNVFNVGEPGLDNFRSLTLMSREELAENLNIDPSKKWVLMTYHSETRLSVADNLEAVRNIIVSLDNIDNTEIIITKANADFGGEQINAYLQLVANGSTKYKLFASLGQLRYLSFMTQAALVIGNSSSGIVEAPYCRTPTVNVGDRQKGRYLCFNVVQSDSSLDCIANAIDKAMHIEKKTITDFNYYGDAHSAEKIINQIKLFANE